MDCQAISHFSASQCDFPSITGPISPGPIYVGVSCPAKRLLPQQRQGLAIQVLARTERVSEFARQHEVSRKFLHQQSPSVSVHLFAGAPRCQEPLGVSPSVSVHLFAAPRCQFIFFSGKEPLGVGAPRCQFIFSGKNDELTPDFR